MLPPYVAILFSKKMAVLNFIFLIDTPVEYFLRREQYQYLMKPKTRWGKREKQILKILMGYDYVEFSLRLLTSKILRNPYFRDDSKYNSIRNAVSRLEEQGFVETKTVHVHCEHGRFPEGRAPTHLRMVRQKEEGREWECKNGIYFKSYWSVIPEQDHCHP